MENKNLIQLLSLEHLTQEEKDAVLVQITDSLLQRLVVRVYDKLTPELQKEFDALGDAGDQEKIDAFLRQHVPDLDEIRDEELEELIADMKEFLTTAGKQK